MINRIGPFTATAVLHNIDLTTQPPRAVGGALWKLYFATLLCSVGLTAVLGLVAITLGW